MLSIIPNGLDAHSSQRQKYILQGHGLPGDSIKRHLWVADGAMPTQSLSAGITREISASVMDPETCLSNSQNASISRMTAEIEVGAQPMMYASFVSGLQVSGTTGEAKQDCSTSRRVCSGHISIFRLDHWLGLRFFSFRYRISPALSSPSSIYHQGLTQISN